MSPQWSQTRRIGSRHPWLLGCRLRGRERPVDRQSDNLGGAPSAVNSSCSMSGWRARQLAAVPASVFRICSPARIVISYVDFGPQIGFYVSETILRRSAGVDISIILRRARE